MAGKVRKEDLAHQRLILRVNGHTLVVMANMFHGVSLAIVDDEGGSSELPWQICAFYLF